MKRIYQFTKIKSQYLYRSWFVHS